MRFEPGDINLYYFHDTLTPDNVRCASYGCESDSGTLVPEPGDILRNFPGWTGSAYEPITVRVVEVRQIGNGVTAYDVRVTTVTESGPEKPVEECGAYYGHSDGPSDPVHPEVCRRPSGHPPISQDGIGHSPASRLSKNLA